jgi:iron complex outermembrane receptor protein
VATAQDLDGGCSGEDACGVLENPLVGELNLTTRQTYRQFSEEVRFDRDLGPMAQVHAGALFLDGRTDWRTDESADEDLRSWAAFGGVDVHPVSRLTLTGAVRFVDDRQSWSGDAQGSGDWRHVLSRLAADWRLTDALSLFADRTTGFRPGGLALGEALPAASSGVFGSESDVDWEGGIRLNRLGGAVSGELVGFHTRVSGLQAPQTVLIPGLTPGFATPIANLPLVESKGVDLQLAWRVGAVPGLTLSGVGGFDDVSDDPAGAPLPRAPRFDGTARLDYAREMGPGVWAFEAAYRWTDRYALADLGNQGDWQSAYGLLDFSVAYSRGAYRIAVTARNLLNKVYLDTAQPAFFVHGWGEPRTTVVSVQAKF